MRLREIQEILIESIPDLSVLAVTVQTNPPQNPPQVRISNILNINRAFAKLEKSGLFQASINQLRKTSLFNNHNDTIVVSNQEYGTISFELNKLKDSALNLKDALTDILKSPALDGNISVSIKIKEIRGLDDLESIITQLKKVIQLPLSEYEQGGEIKIANFDSGSFWIDLILPTTASVTLIGSIAWAGAVIYKKYLEAFAFRKYVEGLDIQKEHINDLKEAAKKKIDLDIEAEAKLIQNEFFNSEDAEQLNRLKLSIKEYSKLIQKGVEIKPALTAPEQVSNLFPSYKPLELIESKVKKIEG